MRCHLPQCCVCLSRVSHHAVYQTPGFYARSLGWLQCTNIQESGTGPTKTCNFRNTAHNLESTLFGHWQAFVHSVRFSRHMMNVIVDLPKWSPNLEIYLPAGFIPNQNNTHLGTMGTITVESKVFIEVELREHGWWLLLQNILIMGSLSVGWELWEDLV